MDTELRFVGIDPGTTSAVAVLDLDGDLVDYTSRKNFSKDRIIQFMVEGGKPLVVAADVAPAPSLVDEIASNTGSVLFVPDEDLGQGRKEELCRPFPIEGEDSHVRDALAAAEYARREYAPTLDEVRRRVRQEQVEEHLGDVIELVVNGSFAISDAISEVQKVEQAEPEEAEGGPERDWRRIAENRQERIDLLERKVANLQEHVDTGDSSGAEPGIDEEELKRRNRVIRELREEVELKGAELERLASERDSLQEGIRRLDRGWIRVPKVQQLSAADSSTVFLAEYSGGEVAPAVDTVLMEQPAQELQEEGLQVIDIGDIDRAVEVPDAYIVHPAELEDADDPERFMEWLETYRNR